MLAAASCLRVLLLLSAALGRLEQLLDLGLDALGDQGHVLHRVVVAEQAEVDLAVVGHDRDRQRVVLRQEGDREDVEQLAAEHVERDLRPGDVGDDQVEQPGREVDPRRLGEQRRRGEVVEARDHLGAERLLRGLDPVHRLAHGPQPRDRVLDVDGQRSRAPRRSGCRARRAASVARIETGTSARSSRPSVRTPRARSQRRSAPATAVRGRRR